MAVYLNRCVFLHVPKTGGVWIEKTLLKHAEVLSSPATPHENHIMPDLPHGMGCFAFVRHPAIWLKSLFQHRKRKGFNWQNYLELEEKCQATSFGQFINNVCKHENIVDRYFEHYLGKYYGGKAFHIGKTENLCEDLISILSRFDEKFDAQGIRSLSSSKENSAKELEILSSEQIEKIYHSQKNFFSKYQYSQNPKNED